MTIPGTAFSLLKVDKESTFTQAQSKYIIVTKNKFGNYFLNNSVRKELFLKYFKAYRELISFYTKEGEIIDNSLLPKDYQCTLFLNEAIYYIIKNRLDDSERCLHNCLKILNNSDLILSYMALVQYKKSNFSSCREFIKKTIRENINNFLPWIILAKIYFLENKYQTASEMLQTANKINPIFELSKILQLLKQPEFKKIKDKENNPQIIKEFLEF